MVSGLQPTTVKSYISLHPDSGLRCLRLGGLETYFCQWKSQQSSLGSGGARIQEAHQCAKDKVQEGPQPDPSGRSSERGERNTLLILHQAIVRSKLDYGYIVYGTTSNTELQQLDSIHNSGLRLELGAFCTSSMTSLNTEANEAPLKEHRLNLSMHYYLKIWACIYNPAHHVLHESGKTNSELYAARPNGRGGMTRTLQDSLMSRSEFPIPSMKIVVICYVKHSS